MRHSWGDDSGPTRLTRGPFSCVVFVTQNFYQGTCDHNKTLFCPTKHTRIVSTIMELLYIFTWSWSPSLRTARPRQLLQSRWRRPFPFWNHDMLILQTANCSTTAAEEARLMLPLRTVGNMELYLSLFWPSLIIAAILHFVHCYHAVNDCCMSFLNIAIRRCISASASLDSKDQIQDLLQHDLNTTSV